MPRVRVAVLTTGDELVDVSEKPGPGRIRDVNIHSACAQVSAFGALAVPFPRVPDQREAVARALGQAAASADVIVTTGGISVGTSDFVKDVLESLGAERIFWRVAQKPGGPLGFYRLGGKPVFGIPGNPVASMTMMEVYVRPLLRRLMGFERLHRPERQGVLDEEWSKSRPDGRTHLLRVLVRVQGGVLRASLAGPQGSGILSSMTRLNALALIPEDALAVPRGGSVLLRLTEEAEDHLIGRSVIRVGASRTMVGRGNCQSTCREDRIDLLLAGHGAWQEATHASIKDKLYGNRTRAGGRDHQQAWGRSPRAHFAAARCAG